MNRSILFLTPLTLAFTFSALCQQVQWARTYGGSWQDGGQCVTKTADGGFVLTGFNSSVNSSHSKDVLLMKTNASGDEVWSRYYGGPMDDIGRCVRQTADGGYIITGMTEVSPQVFDPFLIRTDSSGNFLWQRSYDFGDDDRGHAVWQTADGGFILAGQAWVGSVTFGSYDMYVVKTDATGNVEWQRTYEYDDTASPGADVALSIQQLSDKGYIIGGFTQSSVWASFLVRTDSLGQSLWSRTYNDGSVNECYAVQTTRDGGFVLTGGLVSYVTDTDVFLIKTDSAGNPIWQKIYGGENADDGESVRELSDGGFAIAGMTASYGAGMWDVYVLRTNASGDTLWTRSFGGDSDDRGYSVDQADDGSIVLAGWSWSLGQGLGDAYVIKLNDTPLNANADKNRPNSAGLCQNFPNPFNPTTTIRFQVAQAGPVTLKVYNVLGQEVASLLDAVMKPGEYSVEWEARLQSSGVYFYRLQTPTFAETKGMILVR